MLLQMIKVSGVEICSCGVVCSGCEMNGVRKMQRVIEVAPAHLMTRIKSSSRSSSAPSLDTIHEDEESHDLSETPQLWKPFMLLIPFSLSVVSLLLQMLGNM